MGDAAAPLHVGRLHHDQVRARVGEHGEMAEVPIGGGAVVGAVLAHGRDDDAILEREVGKLDRREQGAGHGSGRIDRVNAGGLSKARYLRDFMAP